MGGIVGGIFGGGKSKTSQQATNTTEVNVKSEITNVIDVGVIAEAIKATGEQTKDLIANLSKAQILTQIADVQARLQQNETIQKALKGLAILGVIWFLWEKVYNGK